MFVLCCVRCKYWIFFFFIQETVYDLRISDWSSDLCSSDLPKITDVFRELVVGDFIVQPIEPVGGNLFGPRVGITVYAMRSEEHTSELQSLMRNSYAVFCLKKKKNNKRIIRMQHKRL